MSVIPDRKIRSAILVALVGLVMLAAGWPLLNSWRLNRRLSRFAEGTTRIRVWAAGIRTAPGSFCGCAMVPKPERMLYETTDPAVIRALVSSIRAQPHFSIPPGIQSCGTITVDFLREEQMILSLHFMGTTIRSTYVSSWDIPITTGSKEDFEAWLDSRGLRTKAAAAWSEYLKSTAK